MDIVASLPSTKANTLPLPTTDDTIDALIQPKPTRTALFLSPIPAASQQQRQVVDQQDGWTGTPGTQEERTVVIPLEHFV
jgi:hypothetical protein